MVWVYAALAVVASLVLLGFVATRRSAAGIPTSRFGRTLRLLGDSIRMTVRFIRRKMVRAFQSEERRLELAEQEHEQNARDVLETMGNMKGAAMKLGQIISFMDESLPEQYQEQLSQLQNNAPPMAYSAVAQVIRDELGGEPEDVFAFFDERALAAASIGQVHRARLKSGEDVVVKVQYPGVDKAISADLDNAGMIIAAIGMAMPNIDARPIAEEMRSRLLEELDYVREAANQRQFAEVFAEHETIVVPRVYEELSTGRVLTSELIEGRGFADFVATATTDQKRRAVLAMREFVFDSMWFHHLFNGDPHPGNYIFMPDGRVAFIDYGCVKKFDPDFMADFNVLNRSYLLGDKDAYFAKACEMGFIRTGYEDRVDRDWLWEYAKWFYLPLLEDEEFALTPEYCKQALSQMFGENMKLLSMPPEYVMLNRITFGLNSILSKLDACENWREMSMKYYFPDGFPKEAA